MFIQTPQMSGPVFFGTTERTPRIQVRRQWSPVFNDLGGSKVPFDIMYESQESLQSGTFTRWNNAQYLIMAGTPSGLPDGFDASGDIGTYMIAEGKTSILWFQFTYANKPLFAANGMPLGYRWPFTFLESPDDLDELGTNPQKLGLLWHSLRGFNTSTGAFLLVDHDMSAVAGLPLN